MSDMDTWKHEYVESNGLKFHCVTQGQGELLVLLHGFPEFWYSWRHQIPILARRFKVVAPDMRGYGESDKPAGVSEYKLNKLVDDVKGIIDAYGAKKAHIVAHDWGGVVAWAFEAAYPHYIDKLVVMNAPHPAILIKNLLLNPRQLLRSWYMIFFQIPRLPEMVYKAFNWRLLRYYFHGWAVDKSAFPEEEVNKIIESISRPGALTSGMNYYRAMFRNIPYFLKLLNYPKIKTPTMLIWAETDAALGKELTYGMDKYFVEKPLIRYIPNCSHWVQQEQPERVNEFLEEFLCE